MTQFSITRAPTSDEAYKAAALHRVYSYLLQLAARKAAATPDEARSQTQSTADRIPLTETENHVPM